MIKKLLSLRKTFFSFLPLIERKTKYSIYLCLLIGVFSFVLDSTSIVSLSRLDILKNFSTTSDYKNSSVFLTLILLLAIAILNIIKVICVSRSSSLIASDVTKNIYKFHIEKKSQYKDNLTTENIGKNVTRELIRGAYACLLLLPINILSLLGILIGLNSGMGSQAIKLTLIIIFINLFLVILFGNFANKLQYIGTKSEKQLEIISKEIINESEEILVANLSEKKLNKLRDINFKSRVNLSYANSFFRFPGTIYPVINIAIILFAIKLRFLSYEILVPFIYSMQRGNLTFSSFISSLTSLIGSRIQLKLVSDALYKKQEVNQNYVVTNNKKIKVNKKIKLKDIVSISMPNSKRLSSMGNEELLIDTKKVNSSSFLFNFSSYPKPIVLFGESGSGKSTYLKKSIGLTGAKKEECISIHSNISDNIVTPIFELKGFYMSQDVVLMRSNLKDYLNDHKILNNAEIQDLFNWNKKFQLLWPEINNYKDWINMDLSKSSYGEVKRIKFLRAYCGNYDWIALDEPTSGLDTYSVDNVVSAINDLSKRSVVLVCTHENKLIENSLISLRICKN